MFISTEDNYFSTLTCRTDGTMHAKGGQSNLSSPVSQVARSRRHGEGMTLISMPCAYWVSSGIVSLFATFGDPYERGGAKGPLSGPAPSASSHASAARQRSFSYPEASVLNELPVNFIELVPAIFKRAVISDKRNMGVQRGHD